MTSIQIISATPGKNTKENILEIIENQQTGIKIDELSKKLNRPISMLQICLKQLVISKQILARKSKVSRNLIYYPKA